MSGEALLEAVGINRNGTVWQALAHLLARSWFRRVWVMQEAALSSRITVACGNERCKWDDLVAIAKVLFNEQIGFLVPFTKVLREAEVHGIHSLCFIDRLGADLKQGKKKPLHWLLSNIMGHHATDPRDLVLVIVGLITEEDFHMLTFGYQDPVHEIYQSAAKAMLMKHGLISLSLAGIGTARHIPGLPSWIPDYSEHMFYFPYGVL